MKEMDEHLISHTREISLILPPFCLLILLRRETEMPPRPRISSSKRRDRIRATYILPQGKH